MYRWMVSIASKFWPEIEHQPREQQIRSVGDVVLALAALPLCLAGLVWLAAVTDIGLMQRNAVPLAVLFVLLYIFNRLDFFVIMEVQPGRFADSSGSLDSVALWTGLLLFGPAVLWLGVFWLLFNTARTWNLNKQPQWRWNQTRNLFTNLATMTLPLLAAISAYRAWGGAIPLPAFELRPGLLALSAMALAFVLGQAIWGLYTAYVLAVRWSDKGFSKRTYVRFLVMTFLLPEIALPFALLAAWLYVDYGIVLFLFAMGGLLVTSLLLNRLSTMVEISRQQSSQLETLEQLGREIITAPPDASALPELLEKYVPLMFAHATAEVRLIPDGTTLLPAADGTEALPDAAWQWLAQQRETHVFRRRELLPWQEAGLDQLLSAQALIMSPVVGVSSGRVVGGIALTLARLGQPWKPRELSNLKLALASLAAAVASALQQAVVYERSVAYERAMNELELAGEIQSRFLPQELPVIPGWQIAASLKPARQASGDFYDLIPLSNGRIGLVVADVTDKGMGAALYMALSRTLIRTYAMEWATQPALALSAANRRILSDTNADQFVTVFLGVLDPSSGQLVYCSAGHCPAYIIGGEDGKVGEVGENRPSGALRPVKERMIRTGAPLGITTGITWKQAEAHLEPGDLLVLYTDGITEAQNEACEFFEPERMLACIQGQTNGSVEGLQESLLAEVQAFSGSAPQYDDITLMLVQREQ